MEAHRSEFSNIIETPADLLVRLEKFKLFRMKKTSQNHYTLSMDSRAVDYVEEIISNYVELLDFEIKTDKSLSKIRVKILNKS